MKIMLLSLYVFITFVTSANAGVYYNCVDRDGNAVLTTTPQDGMKCDNNTPFMDSRTSNYENRMNAYKDLSPAVRNQIIEIDEKLDKLEEKSKEKIGTTKRTSDKNEGFKTIVPGVSYTEYRDRGLTNEERRQQTDLMRLKARLLTGQNISDDDAAIKQSRQQGDMEDAKWAAQAAEDAENQRQNAEIRRLEQQQKIQRNNDWLDRRLHH